MGGGHAVDLDEYLSDIDGAEDEPVPPEVEVDDSSGDAPSLPLVATVMSLCLVAIFALIFEWIAGQGVSEYEARGFRLVGVAVLVIAGSVISIALLLIAVLRKDREVVRLICVPASFLVAFCAVVIISIESVTAILPGAQIPKTFGRIGVGASAGVGAWIALVAASVLLVVALSLHSAELRERLTDLRSRRRAAAVAVALGVAGIAIARLRYAPLVTIESGDKNVPVALWWFPGIGPVSLIASWSLIASAILIVVGRTSLAAVIGVIAGWLTASMAVWVYAARTLAVQFDKLTLVLPPALREELEQNANVGVYVDRLKVSVTIDAHATEALFFLVAAVASLASLALLSQVRRSS